MFEISHELENSVLANLPENYTKLEKALHIYNELCKTTEYSIDYYVEEGKNSSNFTNVNNLKTVDGVQNKSVVCFTFNAIYAELLYRAKVCGDELFDINRYLVTAQQNKQFLSSHVSLTVPINYLMYDADATFGVLDNNDLVNSKFGTNPMQGFNLINEQTEELQTELQNAINKICANNVKILKYETKYKELKGTDFLPLPIEKRVESFLNFACNPSSYSLTGFNYLLKLKRLLFTNEELHGIIKNNRICDKKIDLLFAKNDETKELEAFLFFNKDGYTDDKDYENTEKLAIHNISLKNKTQSKTSVKEFTENYNKGKYLKLVGFERDLVDEDVQMILPSTIIKELIYDGKPLHDQNQNPLNAIGAVRVIASSGEKIKLWELM